MALPRFLKKLVGVNGDEDAPIAKPLSLGEGEDAPSTYSASVPPTAMVAPATSPVTSAGMLPMPTSSVAPDQLNQATPTLPSFIKTRDYYGSRAPKGSVADEFNAHMDNPMVSTDWSQSKDPFAQDRYNAVTHNGTALPQRSWKEALKNIAAGALQGAAASPYNPLAGALGGAAVGGIGGVISPTAGASYRFNQFQLPQLLQNRQMAQEQALNEAKVNAENQKAAQEAATARSKGIIKTDQGLYDARTGKLIPGTAATPKPNILNVPIGGAVFDADRKNVLFSNPQTKQPNPPAPHWVMDENGNYVDLNKSTTPVRGYQKEPNADLTPYQKANIERQERQDAAKLAAQVEEAKSDANKAWKSGDKEAYETALGQHKALAESLRSTYPNYYNIDIDSNGWANIKPTGAGRRDVSSLPVRGGKKGGASTTNLYDPNKYADLK